MLIQHRRLLRDLGEGGTLWAWDTDPPSVLPIGDAPAWTLRWRAFRAACALGWIAERDRDLNRYYYALTLEGHAQYAALAADRARGAGA